jgi:endonuclease/exonuclease/phosphatase family metal-dependent hydrolase
MMAMMRLLSWNVQSCRGMDGKVDAARTAAEARRLADPDVACLQEIDSDALLHALPEYQSAWASGVDVPGEKGRFRSGNVILTRYPVGRILRHSLPWPASPDTPSMPRVAVEAVVDAPFGALRVITTHLEYYSSGHRSLQIDSLRRIFEEGKAKRMATSEDGPFRSFPRPAGAILCGDFNLKPDDPLHDWIQQIGLVDAWQALHPGEPHPPTFRVHEAKEAPYCCDFVFVTPDLAPRLRSIRVDGATQVSDHQPVIVELG